MQGPVIAFFVLAVALVIGGAILAARAAKRRRMALEAWARRRGWHYTPDHVSSMDRRFAHFECFQQGSNRYAYNVMRGEEDGRDVFAFDYHYETYSTDSKGNRQTHHHHFSAVVLDSGLRLAPLSIRTENFLDRMKGVFGFDDIDFESAEFSRTFWVKAENKRWAYDVIHQGTMEFLLHAPRFTIEFEGPHVLVHRGRRFAPRAFVQALDVGRGILDRLPADIRKRLQL